LKLSPPLESNGEEGFGGEGLREEGARERDGLGAGEDE